MVAHVKEGQVTVMVNGEPLTCDPQRPLLNELLRAGKLVPTACGGKGVCHLCRVTVLNRELLTVPSRLEKRALGNVLVAQGMRLSCQISAREGLQLQLPKVETPEERRERIQRARARRREGR